MAKNTFPAGLYVAATPLGHLSDITERVREALACCDLVYAEDTRRAQALLGALGIARARGSLRSLHAHNEAALRDEVVAELGKGLSIALITDAGTPAISDPGSLAVDAAWSAGFAVSPLPGPSAVIAALSVSGFVRWPMSFWGFAPSKASARRTWLASIKRAAGLAVIFETPHRAHASLQDCADVFGPQTPMLFGREMTKQHETFFRASIAQVQQMVAQQQADDPGAARGELAWVFDLGEPHTSTPADVDEALLHRYAATLAAELPAAAAAKCLSKMLGVDRDEAYQAVMASRDHLRRD